MISLFGAFELPPELIGVWWKIGEVLRLDLLGQLILAGLLGGAVGLERELSGKAAGLRTNLLICVGSTILTILSLNVSAHFVANEYIRADPARLAAQIVSGIGFLGAGTIIQARGSVTGLTTAATLWVVAAIGMATGTGAYTEAAGSTVLVLFTLVLLGRLEDAILATRVQRSFRLELEPRSGVVNDVQMGLEEAGLRAVCRSVRKPEGDGRVEAVFDVRGGEERFRKVQTHLLDRNDVRGFHLE